jgi:hypothetical protein
MTLQVAGPGGRTWRVRVYRWRRPPWRPMTPEYDDLSDWMFPILIPIYLVMTVIGLTLIPLAVFLAEALVTAIWSLFSTQRFVEAVSDAPPSRLSWVTASSLAPAVAEQVARQLELGYDRIQPHNAAFLGFG